MQHKKLFFSPNINWVPCLNSRTPFKDSITLYHYHHLNYTFQYSGCSITYYGEIERHLNVRTAEHVTTSPLLGKRPITTKKITNFVNWSIDLFQALFYISILFHDSNASRFILFYNNAITLCYNLVLNNKTWYLKISHRHWKPLINWKGLIQYTILCS